MSDIVVESLDELVTFYTARPVAANVASMTDMGPGEAQIIVEYAKGARAEIERLRSLLKEAGEAMELTLAWAPSPILSEHASSLEFARTVLSKIKGEA